MKSDAFGGAVPTALAGVAFAYYYFNWKRLWKLEYVLCVVLHLYTLLCSLPPKLFLQMKIGPMYGWILHLLRTGDPEAPYIDQKVWAEPELQPRKGDVVVIANNYVGAMIHQLRELGEGDDFSDIMEVVAWPELKWGGAHSARDRMEWFEKNVWNKFKFRILNRSHFQEEEKFDAPGVKYVWMYRDLEDQIESFDAMFDCINRDYTKHYGHFPEGLIKRTGNPPQGPFEVLNGSKRSRDITWGGTGSLLDLTDNKSMFCIVERELRAHPRRELARLAKFLGLSVPESKWTSIVQKCSLAWMTEHAEKFDYKIPAGPAAGSSFTIPGMGIRKLMAGALCDPATRATERERLKWNTFYDMKVHTHYYPELYPAKVEKRLKALMQ